MSFAGFAVSKQGISHIERSIVCQDASRFCKIQNNKGETYAISAIADGVGSCTYSDIGSKYVVDCAVSRVSYYLSTANQDVLTCIRCAFSDTLEQFRAYSEEREIPMNSMATTLTLSVYDGSTVYYGHSGDGGIIVLNDDYSYQMITHRHKGEWANSVIPFSSVLAWEFGSSTNVVSFLSCTDGFLDFVVDSEVHNCRVLFPQIKPALTTHIPSDAIAETIAEEWSEYLDTSHIRDAITDDISIVVVVSEQIKDIDTQNIVFDANKWEEEL